MSFSGLEGIIDRIETIPKDAAVVVVYADHSKYNLDRSAFQSFAASIRQAINDDTFVLFMPMGSSIETITCDQINSAGLATLHQLNAVTSQRDAYRAVLEGAEYSDLDGIGFGTRESCLELGRHVAKETIDIIAQHNRLLDALTVFHSEVAEISDSGDAGECLQEPCKAAASAIAAIVNGGNQ